MPTIHDVARRAGVSSATVSHVINNSRYVAPHTRSKVLVAIESLQYRQNAVARSLRRNRTGTIGLMISDISNPYFSNLVRGVEDAVYEREDNCKLILCNTDENSEKERLCIEMLLEKRVDGLILAPVGGNVEFLQNLAEGAFPLVMVDRFLEAVSADSVVVDNRAAAFALTDHLIRLGHRRVAVVMAELTASSIEERIDGYKDAHSNAGIALEPDLFIHSNSDIDSAHRASAALLASESAPSAVFCTNNFMTLGMIRALNMSGKRCPEDIAVVGFDDFHLADSFRPPLTVAAQPAYEIGQEAAKLLFDRVSGKVSRSYKKTVLETSLLIRGSCGSQ
ncbi:MAG: LacI family DNA-binding transcriptional regulator [Albidovulum sp.]|nr:LacI family DNA-binding transcriptional regulator [Albidovulum sp.]